MSARIPPTAPIMFAEVDEEEHEPECLVSVAYGLLVNGTLQWVKVLRGWVRRVCTNSAPAENSWVVGAANTVNQLV